MALAWLALTSGCPDATSKGKKPFGEACALHEECESMACAAHGGFCSKGCRYDRECGAGLVCRSRDDGPGGICSSPRHNPPAAQCMTEAECQHGRCLHRSAARDQPGFCSTFCETAADCPSGMKLCEPTADSGELKLCIPEDEAPLVATHAGRERRSGPPSAPSITREQPDPIDVPAPRASGSAARAEPPGAERHGPGGGMRRRPDL